MAVHQIAEAYFMLLLFGVMAVSANRAFAISRKRDDSYFVTD